MARKRWDLGRADAWWWAAIPIVMAIGLIVVDQLWPDFYRHYILPEGFGFLELGHFIVPAGGALICLTMLRYPLVKASRFLWWLVLLMALGCVYIAGEEHSWGQHFFGWQTPDGWAAINRQQETNLHNVSSWFNHTPKTLFDIGLFVGGIAVPIYLLSGRSFEQPFLQLLAPPAALMVTVAIGFLYLANSKLEKMGVMPGFVQRPSEASETFQYLFLLYYPIVLRRRVAALEAAGVRSVSPSDAEWVQGGNSR